VTLLQAQEFLMPVVDKISVWADKAVSEVTLTMSILKWL
jgi:hypothetical protein